MMDLMMRYYDPARDFGHVYRLFVDPDTNPLILYKPDHNDVTAFQKWLDDALRTSFNDFFVFYHDHDFVGFAYSYEFAALDGHCRFSLAVTPEMRGAGCGAIVSFRFLQHLFDSYPLRKVYFHVYAYNADSMACARALAGQEECVLKEYHYHKGAYHDLHVFAVDRRMYDTRISKFVKGGGR